MLSGIFSFEQFIILFSQYVDHFLLVWVVNKKWSLDVIIDSLHD